jgi:hypothetical protein
MYFIFIYQFTNEDEQKIKKPIIEKFEKEGSPYYSTVNKKNFDFIFKNDFEFSTKL